MEKKKRVSYAKYGYFFVIPFVLAFAICMLYPIIYTIIISFTDMQGAFATEWHFLGGDEGGIFANYKYLIQENDMFLTAVKNTFKIWILNFIPQILLALLLAAWFTNNSLKVKGQGFFKFVFYLPNIMTASTIAILFHALFLNSANGPVNAILLDLGIIDKYVDWDIQGGAVQLIIAFIQFWMWYGNTMIVLIAGILGISPELYEAASIDGATGTQQFFRITLPNLKTILLYTLVTSMVGGLQMFDIPKVYLDGRPNNASLTTSVFIQKLAFEGKNRYQVASAASMIMFAIICVISAFMFFLMRDKDEEALYKMNKKKEKEFKKKLKEQGGAI